MANKPSRTATARSPGPVRSSAGAYLRDELLVERFGPLLSAWFGVGMLLGVAIILWFGTYFALLVGITMLLTSMSLWVWRRSRRNAFEKGHVAERQIGRALEQALTTKRCVVAHNVTTVMDSGDIDHIVATPTGVWVIETKYRRVPEKRFPKVLSRLHACRSRIEALLPPGTPVRACLVLAYEPDSVKRKRNGIVVHNHDTFRDEFLPQLRAEKEETVAVDERASSTIWRLSRGEPVSDFAPPDQRDTATEASSTGPAVKSTDAMRDRPSNAYEPWTSEDDRMLRKLHGEGWNVQRLAEHFGRTRSAIKRRLLKLDQPDRR